MTLIPLLLSFILTVKVIDITTSEPVENAVLIVGKNYTYTDSSGTVRIEVDNSIDVLKIVRAGYKTKEITLRKDIPFIVVGLEPEAYILKGVKISSAYTIGTEKKENLTMSEVILDPGAAASVFWAVKDLPSTSGNEDVAPIITRGGDPTETVVYLEKARLFRPYVLETPSGGVFSFIKTDYIKKAEYIPGGFGAEYEGGMSGVLSLMLKDRLNSMRSFSLNLSGTSFTFSTPYFLVFAERNDQRFFAKINNLEEDVVYAPVLTNIQVYLNKYLKVFSYYLDEYSSYNTFGGTYEITQKRKGVVVNKKLYSGDFGFESSFYYSHLYKNESIEGFWGATEMAQYLGMYMRALYNEYELGGELFYPVFSQNETYKDTNLPEKTGSNFIKSIFLSKDSRFLKFKVKTGLRATISGNNKRYISPRFQIVYPINEKASIFYSTGIFYQYLQPYFKKYSFPYAFHNNFGLESSLFPSLQFKFDMYYKLYKNLIYTEDSESTCTGYGKAYGLELYLRKKEIPLIISYGLMYSERCTDTSGLVPFENDIRHKFTFIGNFTGPLKTSIGIKLKYHSGKPYTPLRDVQQVDSMYVPVWGEKNSLRLPPYFRFDLRISRNFYIFNGFLVTYIEIENLTNHKNVIQKVWSWDYKECEDLIILPRTYIFGFVYNF